MVIWIFDYCVASVTKIQLSKEHSEEINEKYDGLAEDFLYDHEEELGISMKDSSYMVTTDDVELEEKEF